MRTLLCGATATDRVVANVQRSAVLGAQKTFKKKAVKPKVKQVTKLARILPLGTPITIQY